MKVRKIISALLAGAMVIGTAVGCSNDSLLNKNDPVTITIWHYYNDSVKTSFDNMIDEFNETVGAEKGIVIETSNYGTVSALEEAVHASMNHEVGSPDLPTIVSTYADTATDIYNQGMLQDLSVYFTADEISQYVDSYIDEGCLGKDGLYILPTAKSTEVMIMNKTDWDKFAADTGVTTDQLATWEGVAAVSEKYYEWSGGKAFFGKDSMANTFISAARQFGGEILSVDAEGKVTLNADKTIIKKIWDNYYIPFVSGYYCANGRFRSDDAKVGDLIAMVGSTSSSVYFPSQVTVGEETYPIESMVLETPIFEGGEKVAIQQGAGMAVTKSDDKHAYAASVFLKWFTETERNLSFTCSAGYLSGKKDAGNAEYLDAALSSTENPVNEIDQKALRVSYEIVSTGTMYTLPPFQNSYSVRNILEYNLSDKCAADKEAIAARIDAGEDRTTVLAEYTSDDAFDTWYDSFVSAINEKLS